MKRVRVVTTTAATPGVMLVLPDPNTDDFSPIDSDAENGMALVIACHPDDRERVLDHLCVAQEHAQ